jgi:hypothetical protein
MASPRVVVVGGGFSGCAAAIAAAKVGAEVLLLERTDMLTGAGIRAGRMNNNGKLVLTEEAKALGGGEVFEALESIVLHRGNIVDEQHGYVYNTCLVEPKVRELVETSGVELRMEGRATEVEEENESLRFVILNGGEKIGGDVFIDCSGTAGGVDMCTRYGHGCAMCASYRCPVFGNRVSIATKAGAPELMRMNPDGSRGAIGAAIMIHKDTLSSELRAQLEKDGVVTIPLPKDLIDYTKQHRIGGIRSRRQMESVNLVDIGSTAKCVGLGYMSLANLRRLPGLEMAMIEDPLGGGKFNNVSKVSMAPREPSLKVKGLKNLLVAGEKAGPGGGITEVICTGILAGNNAVRIAAGREALILPESTAIGDFIAFTGKMMETQEGLSQGYSVSHGLYFERMKELGLYSPDPNVAHGRIEDLGLKGSLAQRID